MRLLFLFIALIFATPAAAQTIVLPSPLQSGNVSSTIAVTNTFQSLQAQTTVRKGCLIENNGTHLMYVFWGPVASATTSNSFILAAGLSVSCAVGGTSTLTDQVSITGTSGDAFFANFQ